MNEHCDSREINSILFCLQALSVKAVCGVQLAERQYVVERAAILIASIMSMLLSSQITMPGGLNPALCMSRCRHKRVLAQKLNTNNKYRNITVL